MTSFAEYVDKYERIRMEREDGILQMTFHTDGGSLRWGIPAHIEFERVFADVADDRENLVVIMTGTGDEFSGPPGSFGSDSQLGKVNADQWDRLRKGGKDMLWHLLRIEAPVIGAVNGPALRHCELPLMSDIVLAAEQATFQDSAHFVNRTPPGDGQHVLLPAVMGMTRARYFLLTGQTITAQQALNWGLVNEVLPREQLLPRAWEIARQLIRQPPMVLRNSRLILTQELKGRMHDLLEYGLNFEGLGVVD
jgi:enoyl-CoA hydratase/carnithine racemase